MSKPVKPLEPHALALLFPPMLDTDFEALVADVKRHGLREEIVLFEGRILDGVHRARACAQACVNPKSRTFPGDGDAALAYVMSANLRRRHLDTGQRAIIAKKLETLKHGGDRKSADQDAKLRVDRKTAAKSLGVSERSVTAAAVVLERGTPELITAVEKGGVPIDTAATLARSPHEEQAKIIGDLPRDDKGKVTPAARKALRVAARVAPWRAARPKSGGKSKSKGGGATTSIPSKAPSARDFKDAVNHFAAGYENLFGVRCMGTLESPGISDEQRRRLVGYLQQLIQKATALQRRLDASWAPETRFERAIQTSREREKVATTTAH